MSSVFFSFLFVVESNLSAMVSVTSPPPGTHVPSLISSASTRTRHCNDCVHEQFARVNCEITHLLWLQLIADTPQINATSTAGETNQGAAALSADTLPPCNVYILEDRT